MKSLVKFFITAMAIGLMASAPSVRAQDAQKKGRGAPTPQQQVERIETAVGKLSDDQKTKITAIYEKLGKDVQALDQSERRTKGQELRTAAQKDVRALLTEDQQKKFDDMPAAGGGGGKKKKSQ